MEKVLPSVTVLEHLSVECASQRNGLGVGNDVAGHEDRTEGGCVVYKAHRMKLDIALARDR